MILCFSTVKNPQLSASDLNNDLDVIRQCAHQRKFEFNPDPTKQATEVLYSCKKSSPNHPQIMFNGTVVAEMNDQIHLGLILDSSLSFKKHLSEKIIKAKKNIGIINHLSILLSHKTLDLTNKALVRSYLEYCDIIYHIPPRQAQVGVTLNALMEKTERIQYQSSLV